MTMQKIPDGKEMHRQLARRRLLQLLSVGGVLGAGILLPREWVKPVVNQVMLPTHAQLTDPTGAADAT
jgi:hypothetical protein